MMFFLGVIAGVIITIFVSICVISKNIKSGWEG